MAGYGLLPSPLKELHLEKLVLPGDEINGITEKSPALQLLCLINCNLTENLHVNISPISNLPKLIIEDEFVEYNRMQHIFINAPKITRIEFLSSMPKRKYHIVNMGVGIEARFNLNRMFRERGEAKATCNGVLVCRYQQNLLGLLKTFQTAKVLEVCSWCIQVCISPLDFQFFPHKLNLVIMLRSHKETS